MIFVYTYDTSQAVFLYLLFGTWKKPTISLAAGVQVASKVSVQIRDLTKTFANGKQVGDLGGDFLGLKQQICRIWVNLRWIAWLMNEVGLSIWLKQLFICSVQPVSLASYFFFCLDGASLRYPMLWGIEGNHLGYAWRYHYGFVGPDPLLGVWNGLDSKSRISQKLVEKLEIVRYGGCIPWGYITLQDHFGWFLYWWAADSMAG